ncbi:hypothetical protein O9G_001216 [Rozella allomycis CSF55]|uniref:Uncharacterized protein n=1 Tax=Rozella allomycis (strain CSF55) TaxID=988480 RepID=A0A075ATG9_ROZAC|nr:hypothetical protein O9G_001216 [Rozella allomycis CSF55]|eukprot:EPZ33465.1 hypothetical protein O9G_001216 [Rozella allomycis CSF55]
MSKTLFVGCLFHFKQALHNRFKKSGFIIGSPLVEYMLKDMTFLTIVNPQFMDNGIEVLRERIKNVFPDNDEGLESKINDFFKYFDNVWLKRYGVDKSNVHHLKDMDDVNNRTNNICERYNRRLHEKIPTAQPNILTLVQCLVKEEMCYSDGLCQYIRGIDIRYIDIPDIPVEFVDYLKKKEIDYVEKNDAHNKL